LVGKYDHAAFSRAMPITRLHRPLLASGNLGLGVRSSHWSRSMDLDEPSTGQSIQPMYV